MTVLCYDSTLPFEKDFCSDIFVFVFRLEKLSVPATAERSQPVVGNVPGDIKASDNVLQIKITYQISFYLKRHIDYR